MAKFRQNHTRSGKGASSTLIRVVAFLLVLLVSIYIGFQLLVSEKGESQKELSFQVPINNDQGDLYYLPTGGQGEVISHQSYTLSYIEKYEQAEWVAYELTKEQLKLPNLPREKWFNADPKVRTGSAIHGDYTRSGYSRGHLIPAADRSFDKKFQKETFYMSNISPQIGNFNGGIWNELENLVRDWTYDNGRLLIVTGPVLNNEIDQYIGKNRVGVPKLFYKVLLDPDDPEKKGIGFLLKNESSEMRLSDYMVPIDSIEKITNLDFFDELLEDSLEDEIESKFNSSEWPLDESLYKKRINHWNSR